jgi:hypothetical protein
MNTRVILVSLEGSEKQAYLNAIKPLGVQIDTVSTITELHRALAENLYNGIMIDLVTKIKASKDEKALIHQILELYPVVQLKLEDKSGSIQTLYFGQSTGMGTLEDFIRQECRSFIPRKIRSSPRRKIHFNVILSKNANFSERDIENTVTMDVSEGGCFLYSATNWDAASDAWMTIKELKDATPIRGEVRWQISWGKTMKIPGIGVKFENIGKSQLEEILAFGRFVKGQL